MFSQFDSVIDVVLKRLQMDGVGNTHGGVLVLGATNVPWELDPGESACTLQSKEDCQAPLNKHY